MASLRHCLTALLLSAAPLAHAQARFDLIGPPVEVRVTRGDITLPIAAVPNLQPGDTLWLHPQLPPTQSVHYLLIVAFLRGTTNPPPDDWFTRIETWNKNVREEGAFVTVPPEAEQAVLFLAPETGGDFGTLRSAVKGRPGIFVRASQDLAEAGFEQARIDRYLAAMKLVPPGDPKALQEHSDLLARTLNLKPNPDCFKKPLDLQYNCLTQSGSQTLLDDGHGQSMLAALSGGDSANLIGTASATQFAGGGTYSAYVGTIVDFVHIMDGLHTAKYQYIPAIAFPDDAKTPESLNLRLNTPPSFNNPKSVIVISMPAVQKAVLPPLRPVDPSHISCLLDPKFILPIEGAPLVFSTAFARDLILQIKLPAAAGKPAITQNIPLIPDAFQGGLVHDPNPSTRKELPLDPDPNASALAKKDAAAKNSATPETAGPIVTGSVKGEWGFDPYSGPTVQLQRTPGVGWRIVTAADTNLIIGQPNHLQLAANGTACIRSVDLEPGDAKVDWKLAVPKPDAREEEKVPLVDLTLNLQHAATPGSIHLAVQQFGESHPDEIGTRTFSEPAKIEALQLHAGDTSATLTGTSLGQVKDLTLKDLTFTPACPTAPDAPCDDTNASLPLTLPKEVKAPSFRPGEKLSAAVHLNDGRTVDISTTVLPPRPVVTLLTSRVVQPTPSPIQLTGPSDLPLGAKLTFFLKSKQTFPRSEEIELANQDASLHTTLSVASGTLIMEDSHTVLATFDPLKTFGPSTFGPFRLRAIAPASAAEPATPGDWLPLATIVRLPTLTNVHCPADPNPCQLNGSELYLIDSLSVDPSFTAPAPIPDGFVDTSFNLPHPALSNPPAPTLTLYLRLRDDPTTIHSATLPLQSDPPSPAPNSTHHISHPAIPAAPNPPPIP